MESKIAAVAANAASSAVSQPAAIVRRVHRGYIVYALDMEAEAEAEAKSSSATLQSIQAIQLKIVIMMMHNCRTARADRFVFRWSKWKQKRETEFLKLDNLKIVYTFLCGKGTPVMKLFIETLLVTYCKILKINR